MITDNNDEKCRRCMEYMFPEIAKSGVSKTKIEILQRLSQLQNEKLELEIMNILRNSSV